MTTNYDLHLSEALEALGKGFTQETAPALPLGDDFNGIVYLHGRLGRPARQLVVTDADFGQAYLRDAWATRFLERMFTQYTVLFIGYSHSDVVVSYLGRGLRTDSPRFVLTDDPDSLRWRRLGITPVAYPNPDGLHQAVAEAISGWASWASMGLLEHRQRVARLVAAAPSQVPEEMSYLETVIADSGTVGFFAEHARGPEWLAWAAAQGEFQNLFNPALEGSDCARALAFWFAEYYVMEEGLSDDAWALVSGARGVLGPHLWDAIGFHLHRRPAEPPRPGWLSRWLVLMAQNAPRSSSVPWVEYALMKAAWPQERAVALLLFDSLTEPQAQLQPSFALPSGGRVQVELRGDRWSLGEAWAKVFGPCLADAARDLIVIIDRQLRRAHAVLSAIGAARPGWDPMCFSRSAVEPHPQDNMPESADLLIDAARDCLVTLLTSDPDAGVAYLHLWANADVPLLRRLAVHGWIHRADLDASAKLTWLRSRGWLFDHQLRHEVFALLATTVQHATRPVVDALVADAAMGPAGSEHQEYEAYNALAWIARHAPGLESVRAAFAEAQARHPEYAERSHPDLTGWVEVGWVRPQPPMSSEELHRLIQDNPVAAISQLRRKASQPSEGGWEDALDVISGTNRDWPSDGLTIFDAIDNQPDVLGAVVRGWGAASAGDTDAPEIIGRLSRIDLSAIFRDVTRMLSGSGQSQPATSVKWQEIPAARLLAVKIWAMIADTPADQDAENWLALAINHPAGQLAQFWVSAIAADWQAAGDNWTGLPTAARDQLEAMLAGEGGRTEMAEVIFASQLHFFRAADSEWCLDHVLPLLDWADPARARRTWDGFLAWGRFDSQLLAAGLLDQYIQAATRAADFPDDLRRQLYGHLSAAALHTPDPATREWARALTASVDLTVRVAWMNQIGWHLATLPAEAAEEHWRSWMQEYWKDRLASIPTQLTTEEATAMAPWVICLAESLEEGVRLAIAGSSGARRAFALPARTDKRAYRPGTISKSRNLSATSCAAPKRRSTIVTRSSGSCRN